MKKVTLLFITFMSLAGFVKAQWVWQNPTPTGNELRSVNFPDAETGYIVGYYGTILKTTDAGNNWNVIRDNEEERLLSVDFTDALNGVAVGSNLVGFGGGKILRTTDGGVNWVDVPNIPDLGLFTVKFPTPNIGYAAGNSGTILKTTDAGQTWSQQYSSPSLYLYSSFFLNENKGYVGGGDGNGGDQGKLLMTNDGGQTWEQVTTITSSWGSFASICFTDAVTGYVGTATGYILKTVDGGVTWDMQSSGGGMVRDFSFYDASNGYCAVSDGGYSKTTDGGASWAYVSLPFGSCSAYSVTTTSDSAAYVVGCNGHIFRTQDSGLNWTSLRPTATGQTLLSIFFTNPSTAYTVGNSSTILKTTNAGDTWNAQTSPVSNIAFNSIFFTDENTGFIAGNTGNLLSTVNGGTEWTAVASGTTAILNGIHFPTAQTGYVAGHLSNSGRILKTTDGGETWTQFTNNARTQFSVYFTSVDTGYTCGSASTVSAGIFKTTDGGATWERTVISNTNILYSIVFPQSDTGYCAGQGGVILKTTDAGVTWNQLNNAPSIGWIRSLFFFDANTGYAISGNKLIKTTDGGLTWELEQINQNLLGQPRLWCSDENTMWAVSNLGTILYKGMAIPPSPPIAYPVTGTGSYCQGSGGLEVGLSDSETETIYTLYKNTVAQEPTVAGTGSPISFGLQTEGTYTVEGTNSTGTTIMTGSAELTEILPLTVGVTITSDQNNVCPGTTVTFTASPENGGTPFYQWFVNSVAVGDDEAQYSYIPENGDEIYVEMTSDLSCVTNNPASSNTIVMSVIVCQPWNFTITGQVHTINIPVTANPNINGTALAAGDWIGVFFVDGNGVEHCAGAVQWNLQGSVINAYGNDPTTPEKDGFAANETFKWRMFEMSTSTEFSAGATYDASMPNQGNFADFGLSKLTSLQVMICQNYAFSTGWNSISSYITPFAANVETMFAPIVDELVIMRNLASVYWPGQNINTIGNFNNASGYALKVTEDIDFEICGPEFTGRELVINQGWSYLPVLSECDVNAMELFGSHLNDIVIIQDLIGINVFWPQFEVYTLENFEPGKAYKIKLANAVTVTFPECTTLKSNLTPATSFNSMETGWGTIKMTPYTQSVVFLANSLVNFNAGDMIGAFDESGKIWGFVQINSNNQNQTITLFGDDFTTLEKNGFAAGEPISFKLMCAETGEVIDLEVEYDQVVDNATGTFLTNSVSAVTHVTLLQTGIDQFSGTSVQMYPNPARDLLNFSINGVNDQTITVEIYDNKGVAVARESFSNNTVLNISHLAPGVYFVNIRTTELSETRKLVIR